MGKRRKPTDDRTTVNRPVYRDGENRSARKHNRLFLFYLFIFFYFSYIVPSAATAVIGGGRTSTRILRCQRVRNFRPSSGDASPGSNACTPNHVAESAYGCLFTSDEFLRTTNPNRHTCTGCDEN